MAIIWRVENEFGRGPYNPYNGPNIKDAFYEEFNHRDHPPPSECRFISARWQIRSDTDVFGFASVADYLAWFHKPSWRCWLVQHGYKLVQYDAFNPTYGLKQVIFDKMSARQLAVYSPLGFDVVNTNPSLQETCELVK
jgi:hypothetical protein